MGLGPDLTQDSNRANLPSLVYVDKYFLVFTPTQVIQSLEMSTVVLIHGIVKIINHILLLRK